MKSGYTTGALAQLHCLIFRGRLSAVSSGNQPNTPEAKVQQTLRLEAAKRGIRLWRNNNGACKDITGRMVRFGLANDSKKVNARIKSSDLIGITPIKVSQTDVGHTFGIFTSLEVKKSNWEYTDTTREKAQLAWLELVATMGGIAKFVNKKEDL